MSSRERVEAALARIAAEDGAVNAFVHVDADGARAAAVAADRRRAEGTPLGPLDGVVLAIKDNFAVACRPWAAGIAGRRDLIAGADATAVARLCAAGAVAIGRTNMAEAAFGAVTDNPAFGRTDNPLVAGHVAGGSSGGSAAAVAAGFCDIALGSDTLGSVRIPAACCGVFGLKPTFGLAGRGGLAPLAPSLDTVGVMAADAALLWPAVAALAGPDGGDPDSLPAPADWARRRLPAEGGTLRVAVPRQLAAVECEAEVLEALRLARAALAAIGAEVVEADLSGWEPEAARRAGVLMIEAEGAVEMAALMQTEAALSAPLAAALRYGRDAPSAKIVGAMTRMRAASAAAHRALGGADLLLLPTTPQRAFPHSQPAPSNQAALTALANFAGLPAVSVPVLLPGEALPAAVQLIGPAWSEAALAGWAARLSARLAAALDASNS